MSEEYESLVEAILRRAASIPDLAALNVRSLIQPSIRLTTTAGSHRQLELGGSRIGGTPDVPPGWEWPRWGPPEVRRPGPERRHPDRPSPLGFIAQIDLAAMPRVADGLSNSGWLYFFYDRYDEPWGFDPADRGCCRVFHVEGDRSRLVRAEPPADLETDHEATPCRITARLEPTLPDELPGVTYNSPICEAYWELCRKLTDGDPVQHRLLGHPQVIQNPMELECQLASNGVYCGDAGGYESEQAKLLADGAGDWRLLLQIDTDEDGPGWMWGDCGRIYFWIKRQDLCSGRFDDVWLIFQCC